MKISNFLTPPGGGSKNFTTDINSNKNKISFERHKHGEIQISVEEYLNALSKSNFIYLNQ